MMNELHQKFSFPRPLVWREGDIPAYLEGGAGCEDTYRRIEEERRNQKLYAAKAMDVKVNSGLEKLIQDIEKLERMGKEEKT